MLFNGKPEQKVSTINFRIEEWVKKLARANFSDDEREEIFKIPDRIYKDEKYRILAHAIINGNAIALPKDAIDDPYILGLSLAHPETGKDFVMGMRELIRAQKNSGTEDLLLKIKRTLERLLYIDNWKMNITSTKAAGSYDDAEEGKITNSPDRKTKVIRELADNPNGNFLPNTISIVSVPSLVAMSGASIYETVLAGIITMLVVGKDSTLKMQVGDIERRMIRTSILINNIVSLDTENPELDRLGPYVK